MKRSRLIYALLVLSVFGLLAIGIFRAQHGGELYTYSRILMGTVVEITLREDAPEAASAAFDEIARLEAIFTTYRKDSELSRINAAAPEPVRVSPEVAEAVELAFRVCELTDGAFDPTVGPLVRLWNFSEGGRVPRKEELEQALAFVGCHNIRLDKDAMTVALSRKGVSLDLGGIAKGYIVDKALEVLKERGIEWAIINAGGDVTFYSVDPSERFRVGIRHPDRADGLLGTILVGSGSVATSGDYERYFIKDGVRYHHILDPRTGMPARGLRSVTVVSKEAYLADALATAIFVMGKDKGLELAEKMEGLDALVVDEAGGVYTTSGLEGVFEPFEN